MLDEETLKIARDRLNAEQIGRRHAFEAELQRVKSNAALRGLSHSGAIVQMVADLCGREVKERADLLWTVVVPLIETSWASRIEGQEEVLKRQVGELLVSFATSEPLGTLENFRQQQGALAAVVAATGFWDQVRAAHMRTDAQVDALLHQLRLRSGEPLTTAAFWRFVFREAWNESEFHQTWKLFAGIGTTSLGLVLQFLIGLGSWHNTALCVLAGIAAVVLIDTIDYVRNVISIPPRVENLRRKQLR